MPSVAQRLSEVDTATHRQRALLAARRLEAELDAVIERGGGLPALAERVAELTGKPCAIHDAGGSPHAVTGHPEPRPTDVAGLAAGTARTVGPFPAEGLLRRQLVTPIDVRGRRWGQLMLAEHPRRFGGVDRLIAVTAARRAALVLSFQERALGGSRAARAALAGALVRGDLGAGDFRAWAAALGADLDVPHLVCAVEPRGPGRRSVDADELVRALGAAGARRVLAARVDRATIAFVALHASEAPADAIGELKRALADLTHRDPHGRLLGGISALCRDAGRLPRAAREAREVARCAGLSARRGSPAVLSAAELGPARVVLAQAAAEADAFVRDTLGPVVGADELVRTLHALFEADGGVRRAAELLAVHENTIRYRLRRVQALTGLDVTASADRLTAQLALQVLRVTGHPALTAFDGAEAGEKERAA